MPLALSPAAPVQPWLRVANSVLARPSQLATTLALFSSMLQDQVLHFTDPRLMQWAMRFCLLHPRRRGVHELSNLRRLLEVERKCFESYLGFWISIFAFVAHVARCFFVLCDYSLLQSPTVLFLALKGYQRPISINSPSTHEIVVSYLPILSRVWENGMEKERGLCASYVSLYG